MSAEPETTTTEKPTTEEPTTGEPPPAEAEPAGEAEPTGRAEPVQEAEEEDGGRWSAFGPQPAPVPTRKTRIWRRVTGVIGHEWTLAAAGSVALSAIMTWPTLREPTRTIPQDICDPTLQAWQMAWSGHALTHEPTQLGQSNACYPERYSFAYSDTLLGYAPAGMIGTGPVAALVRYNIMFVLAIALAFFGAYALVRQLGARRLAGRRLADHAGLRHRAAVRLHPAVHRAGRRRRLADPAPPADTGAAGRLRRHRRWRARGGGGGHGVSVPARALALPRGSARPGDGDVLLPAVARLLHLARRVPDLGLGTRGRPRQPAVRSRTVPADRVHAVRSGRGRPDRVDLDHPAAAAARRRGGGQRHAGDGRQRPVRGPARVHDALRLATRLRRHPYLGPARAVDHPVPRHPRRRCGERVRRADVERGRRPGAQPTRSGVTPGHAGTARAGAR